jgi:hypothetical protein
MDFQKTIPLRDLLTGPDAADDPHRRVHRLLHLSTSRTQEHGSQPQEVGL